MPMTVFAVRVKYQITRSGSLLKNTAPKGYIVQLLSRYNYRMDKKAFCIAQS